MASQEKPGGSGPPSAANGVNRRVRRDTGVSWANGDRKPGDLGIGERSIETGPMTALTEDWMERARREAESTVKWEPGADDEGESVSGATPALVRPYARTGGRTKPVRDLDLEALVHATVAGKEASTGPWLNPEHMSIIEMSSGTVSVAEIAARLVVPIGVARVIIADMVDLGLVEVMKTSAREGDERNPDFLRRVLSGLQRL